jgi:regulator of nonsense transcripts 1
MVCECCVQVLIDECGMCPEPHSMIPIIAVNARQVVLIGDHKQLRPVILCQHAADRGLQQSLFERIYGKFHKNTVFLNKQYRMVS